MRNHIAEHIPERLGGEVLEIRIEVVVVLDELRELGAEAVRERLLVDGCDYFIVGHSDRLLRLFIDLLGHGVPQVIEDQPLSEVRAAAFVSEDETAGFDVQSLVLSVIKTGVHTRADDGGEAGLVQKECAA